MPRAPRGIREPLSGPRAGAVISGALVAGAAAVWGALEVAVLLALDGATTAGAAYALIRVRRWRRRGAAR
ncbi:MAG TPA: hypothetical protein VHW23_39705 [Kofleriaceae bacterium]|jgi:hypothetical protein|nr:hypothetical protein [Kofleriaceae bacterium]